MRRHLAAIAAVSTVSLLAAPSAMAATEVGEPCVGTVAEANQTLLVFHGAESPLMQPVTPEEPPQVITSWRVRVGPGLAPLPQRLEVYRILNEAQEYRKEAESATVTAGEGVNVFPTRIPVSWTGYLGLYGANGTFACSPSPQLAGAFAGAAAVGETRTVKTKTGLGVPLTVTLESDRDRDGYGDETQDGCPYNATLQTECPPVRPLVESVQAGRRAILVKLGVSSQAQVQVFGQVGWQVRQKSGPGASRARKGDRGLVVRLSAGAPRTVVPGTVAGFRLPLPKPVLRRLGRLTPAQTLRPRITVRTTDLAGRENDRILTLKLRGRKRQEGPSGSPLAATLPG